MTSGKVLTEDFRPVTTPRALLELTTWPTLQSQPAAPSPIPGNPSHWRPKGRFLKHPGIKSRSCSSRFLRPQCLHNCLTLHPRDCPGQNQQQGRASANTNLKGVTSHTEGDGLRTLAQRLHILTLGTQTQNPSLNVYVVQSPAFPSKSSPPCPLHTYQG